MTEETAPAPALPPEAREALLAALDECRAEVAAGQPVNLALVRFNEQGQPLPTLVGDAIRLHFALTLAAGIIVQGGLNALQLRYHEPNVSAPARTYFASHETGQA